MFFTLITELAARSGLRRVPHALVLIRSVQISYKYGTVEPRYLELG